VNPYSAVGAEVRAALRSGHSRAELQQLTRRMQRTAELLDLTAIGVSTCLKEGRLREAQLRCDAAELAAEELAGVIQVLSARVRDARIERAA
jgi:hypothetical protein